MAMKLYDAFNKAGFGREARTLSTTQNGRTVPAIGHYIAILDERRSNPESVRDRLENTAETIVYKFIKENQDKFQEGIPL